MHMQLSCKYLILVLHTLPISFVSHCVCKTAKSLSRFVFNGKTFFYIFFLNGRSLFLDESVSNNILVATIYLMENLAT